ncbi:MAG: hypothetical protein ABIK65_11965 [Candidatus Eisenbacteria bacterium]
MTRLLMTLAVLALVAMPVFAQNPDPGVQVVDCFEDPVGSGNWTYWFYTCSGDFSANDLHLELTQAEIDEGTVIIGCSVPDLPGFVCDFNATSASWDFPLVGPFGCVPGVSGQYLDIVISTGDGSTIVTETWTLDGAPVGSFTTLVACPPPTSTETEAWGTIKALFR